MPKAVVLARTNNLLEEERSVTIYMYILFDALILEKIRFHSVIVYDVFYLMYTKSKQLHETIDTSNTALYIMYIVACLPQVW